jgi:hypothetical protein
MKIDAQEFFNIGQSLPALTSSKALGQTALATWQIDFHILGPVLTASKWSDPLSVPYTSSCLIF